VPEAFVDVHSTGSVKVEEGDEVALLPIKQPVEFVQDPFILMKKFQVAKEFKLV